MVDGSGVFNGDSVGRGIADFDALRKRTITERAMSMDGKAVKSEQKISDHQLFTHACHATHVSSKAKSVLPSDSPCEGHQWAAHG